MAGYVGLLAVIVIVIFAVGFLIGAILIVAIGIKAEDKATMRRGDRSLVLREQPAGYLARGVRRLTGVGQRIDGSGPDDRDPMTGDRAKSSRWRPMAATQATGGYVVATAITYPQAPATARAGW